MTCRICGDTQFLPVLDLGMMPLADDFMTEERLDLPETRFPLKLQVCRMCRLVQLTHVVPRDLLYTPDYPYVSSTTTTGVAHYAEMSKTVAERCSATGLAVDIGSNVGVLLDGFRQQGMTTLGIEPVPRIAEMANIRGIETINKFFSEHLAHEIAIHRGKATVITGTNVVAHIDNLHELMRGVKVLLAPDGLFVFEAPYLVDLILRREYDTIYHEHLSYLALSPIALLCAKHGLILFDCERRSIHGGTMRYYIAHQGTRAVTAEVDLLCELEKFVLSDETLAKFATDVQQQRSALNLLLRELKRDGAMIVAVGAPAKGMTLLNYCKIDDELLDYVTEKAPLKIGRYTPGTRLPVVSDDRLLIDKPDYALLLPWNFAEEIMANLTAYTAGGGKFIVPVPVPVVVDRIAA